ncbi:MAG: FAD-binding oxidoreductase, partial [Actinobacteria bacterium]
PGDALYDHARTIFYGGIDRRPAAIARVADADDVARVVNLARQSGMELAVRSGGHSAAGFGVSNGGLVIDLRDMRALEIDADHRTAWAETGLTAGEYTAAAGVYSLATGFGDTATVGIGGITLGGGVGFLSRKVGLTIDSLVAADVVTADGKLVRADSFNNPDLFWAIRGGGGNFGVATRFQFRLHPISTAVGGMLILPATPEVIANFIAEAQAAPEELTTIANIMPAPPMPFLPAEIHGKLVLMALMMYAGDIEAGEKAVARFRQLATPLADMLHAMRYPEIFQPEDSSYHPTAVSRTLYVNDVDRTSAETILQHLRAGDGAFRVAQLRVLGGAVSRVPVEETAYAHREARIMVGLVSFYNGEAERAARQAWVDEFAAALPRKTAGAYVNFIDGAGLNLIQDAYPGKTGQRLAQIKARLDPDNLFRVNHNIKPQ